MAEKRRIEGFCLAIESAHSLCVGTMQIEHQHVGIVQRLAVDAETFGVLRQQLRTDIHSVAYEFWVVVAVKQRQVLGHRAAGRNPVAIAYHQHIAYGYSVAVHTADIEVSSEVAAYVRTELSVFQRQSRHIVSGASYGEVGVAIVQQVHDVGAFKGVARVGGYPFAAIRPRVFHTRNGNDVVATYYKQMQVGTCCQLVFGYAARHRLVALYP